MVSANRLSIVISIKRTAFQKQGFLMKYLLATPHLFLAREPHPGKIHKAWADISVPPTSKGS